MPVGVLAPEFVANNALLALESDANADAANNLVLRRWAAFLTGDPLDVSILGEVFLRDTAASWYGLALADPQGSIGDTASMKLQSDYLAAQERAFRMRHASAVRCRLTTAGRKKGQGDDEAGLFARVTNYAADLLAAGGSGFTPRR